MGDILIGKKTRTPQIYFLPKVHKKKNPPPGRPIVSANDCPTERISAFVDTFLRPYVEKGWSYVKDTNDFVKQIREIEPLKEGTILASFDVNSLYTNIPNKEAIDHIQTTLEGDWLLDHKPSVKTLCTMLDYILNKNNFQFNGTNYIQVGGTAMGTRVAPSLANIFMQKIENQIMTKTKHKPKIWLRYIDDIFVIWEHGQEELDHFLEEINNLHHTIKFTMESSKTEMNFLDVLVKVDSKMKMYTSLFCKKTDKNSYLHYNSAHPPSCKKSLPYNQFIRINRICEKETDFVKHCENKKTEFAERGYPLDLLETTYQKVLEKRCNPEEPPRTTRTVTQKNIITSNYIPKLKGPEHIASKNWEYLGRSKTTRKIHSQGLTKGYRRPRNLRDKLVRARLDYHPENQVKSKKTKNIIRNACKAKGTCRYCPKLNRTGKLPKKDRTHKEYATKFNITCNSSNLIYCIKCKRCKMEYVGQTSTSIKERFKNHFGQIKTKNRSEETEVSRHFTQKDHDGLKDVEIFVLDYIYKHPKSNRANALRDCIEYNWINRLKTHAPLGINSIDPDVW